MFIPWSILPMLTPYETSAGSRRSKEKPASINEISIVTTIAAKVAQMAGDEADGAVKNGVFMIR